MLPFGEREILTTMKESIPARFLDLNDKAFQFGAQAFRESE
jgi:hypothetical protein